MTQNEYSNLVPLLDKAVSAGMFDWSAQDVAKSLGEIVRVFNHSKAIDPELQQPLAVLKAANVISEDDIKTSELRESRGAIEGPLAVHLLRMPKEERRKLGDALVSMLSHCARHNRD